ncbi:MAG: glucose-1-phosphate adenylyltransferase [bacterium]
MDYVTAIILGGGRGTRLYPLTLERAKPAVGIAGKYRLIDIPLSNCINSGITRIFVLTQFMSASLHRHIMQTYHFDTFTDGFIDIIAAEQTPQGSDWFQGTADAVRATLNHTTYFKSNHFLILAGDHLYRMDYTDLLRFHDEKHADISVCVCPVSCEEAPHMGLIKVDDSHTILQFVEKPQEQEVLDQFRAPHNLLQSHHANPKEDQYLASMGIYVFKPEVLLKVLANRGQTDFGKEIIPSAIGHYHIRAYPFQGYWRDIGTISTFFETNISLAQSDPPFSLYSPHWPIYTRTRSLPPSRVIASEIHDSLLAEGSDIIRAHIKSSIVGVRSIIGEHTTLKQVVMMGADFYESDETLSFWEPPENASPPMGIGKSCFITNTIIDKNVRIGDNVVITAKEKGKNYNGKNHWVREGITIIPKGAVIPPGATL